MEAEGARRRRRLDAQHVQRGPASPREAHPLPPPNADHQRHASNASRSTLRSAGTGWDLRALTALYGNYATALVTSASPEGLLHARRNFSHARANGHHRTNRSISSRNTLAARSTRLACTRNGGGPSCSTQPGSTAPAAGGGAAHRTGALCHLPADAVRRIPSIREGRSTRDDMVREGDPGMDCAEARRTCSLTQCRPSSEWFLQLAAGRRPVVWSRSPLLFVVVLR